MTETDCQINDGGESSNNNTSDTVEIYSLFYSPIYSLPIRMPGITLSVNCSQPTFQLTLKGSCDEEGVFELNQKLETWKISPLNYALGRLVYDIIWEEGLSGNQPVKIQTHYSAIIMNENKIREEVENKEIDSTSQLVLKHWELDFFPSRWLKLPHSKFLLKKIQVKWEKKSQIKITNNSYSVSTFPFNSNAVPFTSSSTNANEVKKPAFEDTLSQQNPTQSIFQSEFKMAVATIPLKIIPHVSTCGELDFSSIKDQQNILHDSKLNFSHVFGVWLIFEHDVDWNIWHPVVTYWVDEV